MMDSYEECHKVLTDFITLHQGMKQRDAEWMAKLGRTVGGSELAAVTGKNPYSTFYDIVASKIDIVNKKYENFSGLACLWGTLFEDVAAKFVGELYGCEPIGTEICIMSRPGFRYSPDGYIVGSVKANGQLWKRGEDKSLIKYYQPTLIEIKCPLKRTPKDVIPPQYAPQVWAGIEFSPEGTRGLFIDVKIRKCRIDQLNYSADYDKVHKDESKQTECVAWGMTGLFTRTPPPDGINFYTNASEADIERLINEITQKGPNKKFAHVEISDMCCDVDATLTKWENFGVVTAAEVTEATEATDATAANATAANATAANATAANATAANATAAEATAATAATAAAPKLYLYGVLSWKIIDIKTIDVPAYGGYLDVVEPTVKEVNDLVDEAIKSGDPKFLEKYMKKVNMQGIAKKAHRLNDKKRFMDHDAAILEAMSEFPMDFN